MTMNYSDIRSRLERVKADMEILYPERTFEFRERGDRIILVRSKTLRNGRQIFTGCCSVRYDPETKTDNPDDAMRARLELDCEVMSKHFHSVKHRRLYDPWNRSHRYHVEAEGFDSFDAESDRGIDGRYIYHDGCSPEELPSESECNQVHSDVLNGTGSPIKKGPVVFDIESPGLEHRRRSTQKSRVPPKGNLIIGKNLEYSRWSYVISTGAKVGLNLCVEGCSSPGVLYWYDVKTGRTSCNFRISTIPIQMLEAAHAAVG